MQLFASELSADYYTRPPGIVSLVMLPITVQTTTPPSPALGMNRIGQGLASSVLGFNKISH